MPKCKYCGHSNSHDGVCGNYQGIEEMKFFNGHKPNEACICLAAGCVCHGAPVSKAIESDQVLGKRRENLEAQVAAREEERDASL